MDEIGLFPLGVVLLPTEQVPLHIFEPRYRELIAECLEEERPFGLVFADEDGVRDVGTLAAVIEVVDRFPDGRLNIVVEGRERFRLLQLNEGRSFHTGAVEELTDDDDTAPDALAARARALFERLVGLTGADVDLSGDLGSPLSFALAGRFELAADLKLELLRETSEPSRLARVCEILEGATAEMERRRVVAERAQGNGHVPH
ncbi:MAG: LON peptidase substrate-binding domain-containing protein [Gaiella sp.]